jgi:hypothetical protein
MAHELHSKAETPFGRLLLLQKQKVHNGHASNYES